MAYLDTVAGTAREAGVSTAAVDAGALAASAAGRAIMATGLFDAATVADKFGTDSFTNAVVLQLIQDGALAASAAGRALMADAFFSAAAVDAKFAAGAIGEDILTAAELTGRVAAVAANANIIGALPVLFRLDIADATGDTDVIVTHKIRVLDAWALNTGIAAHAANDTWQVKNGANAISDAVAKGATVNAVKRIGSIDPARHEIAAAGTLRVSAVKDTNAAVTLYVLAVRVA